MNLLVFLNNPFELLFDVITILPSILIFIIFYIRIIFFILISLIFNFVIEELDIEGLKAGESILTRPLRRGKGDSVEVNKSKEELELT